MPTCVNEFAVADEDTTTELGLKGRERAQQRRLTNAVSTQQTCQLTLSDGGVDVCCYGLHAFLVAIADVEVFQPDSLLAHILLAKLQIIFGISFYQGGKNCIAL